MKLKTFLLTILVCCNFACNKEKEQLVVTEEFINDMLTSCYTEFKSYIEFSFLFDAVYSNTIKSPNTSWNEIYEHSQISTNDKVNQIWSDAYTIILQTNFIIEHTEEVIINKEIKNAVIAQAKAIRAYLYFNLFTWFGELPIVLEDEPTLWVRSSKQDILDIVKADADFAVIYLPIIWNESEKYKATKAFADALLCRLFLLNHDYNDAINIIKHITYFVNFELDTTVDNISNDSREVYWGFAKGDNEVFNTFFTKGSYIPVFRYTETILAYIEAMHDLGEYEEAIYNINMLKNRRKEPEITQLTAEIIYGQYITELEREGSVFYTLKRYGKVADVLQLPEYKRLLPIPQQVMDNHQNMTQNVGY